jgi:hypothetical protein
MATLVKQLSYTGAEQTYTIPSGALSVTISAYGASGGVGNGYSGTYDSVAGKGAKIIAKFAVSKGDVLHICVGGQGTGTTGTAKDGAGGGSGGGTFIFREIPEITNTLHQFAKGDKNYETLLVAAGGGGTGDESYKAAQTNGYDGNGASPYMVTTNTQAYSTTTNAGTSSTSISSCLGISQYINYDLKGAYYTRSSSTGTGGYGGGSAADDNPSYGGGWYGKSYTAYSFVNDDTGEFVSGSNGARSGDGYVQLNIETLDPPANPTNFRVTGKTESSISLKWDAVSDATSYSMYRNGSYVWSTNTTPLSTSVTFKNLAMLETYTFKLVAANSAGSSSGVTITASTGFSDSELIRDRTQADVDYAKEQGSKIEIRKGAYNITDLNRVEKVTEYLNERLSAYKLTLTIKKDWAFTDIPTTTQMERYRTNIKQIMSCFPFNTVTLPTTMQNLDYVGANHIEQILYDLNKVIDGIEAEYFHAGEIYSGEV